MTDPKISSDPADTSPAEGQSHPIPAQGKGTGGTDTADRVDPAEGGRDETPGKGADLSSAEGNAKASGRK